MSLSTLAKRTLYLFCSLADGRGKLRALVNAHPLPIHDRCAVNVFTEHRHLTPRSSVIWEVINMRIFKIFPKKTGSTPRRRKGCINFGPRVPIFFGSSWQARKRGNRNNWKNGGARRLLRKWDRFRLAMTLPHARLGYLYSC
jgi:hypothetical protein